MKLENSTDLNTFLDFFKQYGDDLVELARLSGDRQNVIINILENNIKKFLEFLVPQKIDHTYLNKKLIRTQLDELYRAAQRFDHFTSKAVFCEGLAEKSNFNLIEAKASFNARSYSKLNAEFKSFYRIVPSFSQ
jgi:hypothetical protein